MADERRRARRFDLSLPVTLLALQEKSGDQQAVRTKDISSTGMFIEFDEDVQIGSKIELIVDLPQEITQAGTVRLSCTGRVVRIDRAKPARPGVAVSIERYQFMRLSDVPGTLPS